LVLVDEAADQVPVTYVYITMVHTLSDFHIFVYSPKLILEEMRPSQMQMQPPPMPQQQAAQQMQSV
jgi:hypothetical protein